MAMLRGFGSVGPPLESLFRLKLFTHDARTLQCCCDQIKPRICNSRARLTIDNRAIALAGR
ncbi:hypothetical protein ASG67_15660 [Sphingomonas sp. Leaf339]|nr:hypothetical protein ASG67_15660 [Sphingomonas sp. Leaf339]